MIAIPNRNSEEQNSKDLNSGSITNGDRSLEFERQFLKRSRTGWLELWQWMCQHSWFQDKLNWACQKVLKYSGSPPDRAVDIKQQALLLMAANLRRRPDLGFDASRGRLSPLLATIILRCCQKALRQFRGFDSSRVEETSQVYCLFGEAETDRALDLADGVNNLPEPWRETIKYLLNEVPVSEIAVRFGCSERTVYRRIERAIEMLRQKLN